MTKDTARASCTAGIVLLGALLASTEGRAACNVIPGTTQSFRASRTTIDRPFSTPGEFVTLGLDPTCAPLDGEFAAAADHVVTVVFTPPHAGPRTVVVLAADCAALEPARQACAARGDVASAHCLPADVESGVPDLVLVDPRHLRVRFPNTDALLLDPADGLTLSGPATLAVTNVGAPLPCALASESCAGQAGLLACVDELFTDGTCAPVPHEVFSHFTALPFQNDYQALCTDPSPPCTGLAKDIRFTVDTAGNLLIPMDWRGVLVNRNAVPIPRLLRASTPLEAFERSGQPIRIPGPGFLGSFSTDGRKLPPLFDPQANPEAVDELTLFGSADAPEVVLRVARRSARFTACAGGANDGLPCGEAADCGPTAGGSPGTCGPTTTCAGGANGGAPCGADGDCPGGECGPGLFDFRSRLARGVGPVVVRLGACVGGANALESCATGCPGGACGDFTLAALDPVPLDGLNQSLDLNAFVMEEALEDTDRNGDGDATDHVIALQNRSTGAMQAIGAGSGTTQAHGRAVARIRQPPFSFPAVAVEDDVVAFLEPEPAQGHRDANGNGTVFETILRVFRLRAGELTSDDRPITADAAPVINGRSVVVSNGFVFFRTAEAAAARRKTERLGRVPEHDAGDRRYKDTFHSLQFRPGGPVSISADGRFVAVAHREIAGLLVHDRTRNVKRRVDVSSNGARGHGSSFEPVISPDGRFVAFSSIAPNLVPGDTNRNRRVLYANGEDVFVHDRATGATERVSGASDGTQSVHDSASSSISADGRFVAFVSYVANPSLPLAAVRWNTFVRDRMTGLTEVVDGNSSRNSECPSISADGRFVAFLGVSTSIRRFVVLQSTASALMPDSTARPVGLLGPPESGANGLEPATIGNGTVDGSGVFVHDRESRVTERVDVAAADVLLSGCPSISADGRFVAFVSWAGNLVPGDTNGWPDVFVYDRITELTERVSVASDGSQSNEPSWGRAIAISAEGRFVAFESLGRDLVPGDTNGQRLTKRCKAYARACRVCPLPLEEQRRRKINCEKCRAFLEHCQFGADLNGSDVFVHDRATGVTERASVASDGTQIEQPSGGVVISADGRFVTFLSGKLDGPQKVIVRGVDETDLTADSDLTGDGLLDDTVLQILDTTTAGAARSTLGPANAVAVVGSNAAFLRPEAAGAPGLPDGIDLNGDRDALDTVVHLSQAGAPAGNLERAAVAIALSDRYVAALVSEEAEHHTDMNNDGDTADTVVEVHRIGEPANAWTNTEQVADVVEVSGTVVAFLTPEAAQGVDLNDDGDTTDRVVQLYRADTGASSNVSAAAEEFVVGGEPGRELVAFRTREAAEGAQDLNDDGDSEDAVLQIYDVASGGILNTHQAVTPCRLEACEPRIPYRLGRDTVTFLTFEPDQDQDLNGDGDKADLVLQLLNVPLMAHGGMAPGACHVLGSASAGVCTNTGTACATDANCAAGLDGATAPGQCFVPPGGCIRDVGTGCVPKVRPEDPEPCSPGQFCEPLRDLPGQGTCKEAQGPCVSTADCVDASATCNNAGQTFHRLASPLYAQGATVGTKVFTSAGRCLDAGRPHGACRTEADCAPGQRCEQDLVVATALDTDGDEIPDAFDNCPAQPNIMQDDVDQDGAGDACEP